MNMFSILLLSFFFYTYKIYVSLAVCKGCTGTNQHSDWEENEKNQTKRGMYKQEIITGYQKKYSHRLLV